MNAKKRLDKLEILLSQHSKDDDIARYIEQLKATVLDPTPENELKLEKALQSLPMAKQTKINNV